MASEATIHIVLEDVNDEIPLFTEREQETVMEGEPAGTPVTRYDILDCWAGDEFESQPKCAITKNVKQFAYCCCVVYVISHSLQICETYHLASIIWPLIC